MRKLIPIFSGAILFLLSSCVSYDEHASTGVDTTVDLQRFVSRMPENMQGVRLGFMSANGDGTSEGPIVVSCHPPSNDWCANGFQDACTSMGGGLSTEPDGGISCAANTVD